MQIALLPKWQYVGQQRQHRHMRPRLSTLYNSAGLEHRLLSQSTRRKELQLLMGPLSGWIYTRNACSLCESACAIACACM